MLYFFLKNRAPCRSHACTSIELTSFWCFAIIFQLLSQLFYFSCKPLFKFINRGAFKEWFFDLMKLTKSIWCILWRIKPILVLISILLASCYWAGCHLLLFNWGLIRNDLSSYSTCRCGGELTTIALLFFIVNSSLLAFAKRFLSTWPKLLLPFTCWGLLGSLEILLKRSLLTLLIIHLVLKASLRNSVVSFMSWRKGKIA